MTFCYECRKRVDYETKIYNASRYHTDKWIDYKYIMAICRECGNEVHEHGISDKNITSFKEAYLKANGLGGE